MDCWEILGIQQTDKEEEIRKAYLIKLPQFHPEENPEGFRALRQALEDAMEYGAQQRKAREGAEEGLKKTGIMDSREIQAFLKEVQEVYQDYKKRRDPRQWRELASCPVCQDLETQKEAGWALLGFLMDHIHLSHSCYKVLDEVFGWVEAEEELYGRFPEGFVRYLTDRIQLEDTFRYDITPLCEDFDYDKFFERYFELRTALGEKDRERVEQALEAAEAMGMEHPDLTILKIRHVSMLRGMESQAWEIARQLYERDKENRPTKYWYVRCAMEVEDSGAEPAQLESVLTSLVEEEPENPGYWQLCGSFLKSQNRLEAALEAFERAENLSEEQWDYLDGQIEETARALSEELEKEGCEDVWAMAHYCWRGCRYDKVREILSGLEPPENRKMVWLMLMAGSCHHLEDYKAALEYRKKIWEDYEEDQRPLGLYMDLAKEYELTEDYGNALEIYGQAALRFSGEPEIYYRQARILEGDGRREEALDMCGKALKEGFHREAFNMRLELLLSMEQYEQVREEAGEIIKKGYRAAQVLYDYARALRELEEYDQAEEILKELYERTEGAELVCEEYAFLCYDMDRTEEALRWVEEAISKRSTIRRQYMKGDYLHDLKRYEEELEIYKEMEEEGTDDWYTFFRIGRGLEGLDRFEEAEDYFSRSVKERSDYGAAWDGLGDVLQKQGKWQEALKAYEAGAENGHLQSTRDLCRLLKRLHEDDKAEAAITEGLKRWPQDGSLLLLRSDILLRKKEYDQVIRCLNRYIEVRPAQAERGCREIAECYERAGDLDKAREYYQKAIDLSPGSARCWRLMGKFLSNVKKEHEEALPYLEKSVELAQDSTYGWMKLGEVYEALGRKEEALECYEKSLANYRIDIEADPTDCCNYEGAADVLIHLGRYDEAVQMVENARALEKRVFICSCPFCYEALEDMAKLEERKGNLKEALEWMKKAGRLASSDYYPKEIARLQAAVEAEEGTEG
ncbi:MAG: tetratricopeptide repeat protein [Hungatella sp.]|nr:tetratricopeptide repeat protein [Hungatella sp.]